MLLKDQINQLKNKGLKKVQTKVVYAGDIFNLNEPKFAQVRYLPLICSILKHDRNF